MPSGTVTFRHNSHISGSIWETVIKQQAPKSATCRCLPFSLPLHQNWFSGPGAGGQCQGQYSESVPTWLDAQNPCTIHTCTYIYIYIYMYICNTTARQLETRHCKAGVPAGTAKTLHSSHRGSHKHRGNITLRTQLRKAQKRCCTAQRSTGEVWVWWTNGEQMHALHTHHTGRAERESFSVSGCVAQAGGRASNACMTSWSWVWMILESASASSPLQHAPQHTQH